MRDHDKTKPQLIVENEELRRRVAALEAADTERGRAEGRSQESQRKLFTLMSNLPGMAYRCNNDPHWTMEFVSEGCLPLTGYESPELLGNRMTSYGDLIHPDDRQTVWEQIQLAVAKRRQFQLEYRIRTAQGQQKVVWEQGSPVFSQDGTLEALEGFITDITDRKRAEEALRQRETRLLEAQVIANLGFYDFDIAAGCWTSSTILNQIFDIPPDYAKTKEAWANLVHPDECQRILDEFFQEAIVAKRPFDREYRIVRHGDKQVRWVHALGRLKCDREGQPVHMLGAIQDVTARKAAEEAIRLSEAKYRHLYENLRDAFVSVDMNGWIKEYNAAYLDLLGYQPEELTARTFWDLTPAKWHAFQAELIAKQVLPRGYSDVYEKEYRRKDGVIVPVELRTGLIRDDRGEPSGMWAILRDITERKRAEEALRRAHDELEGKVKDRTAELQKANEELGVFRRLAEASSQGFGMADMDGLVTYMNPALCRMAGVAKAEDALGKHLSVYYPEGYMLRREKEILPAILQKGHWQGELVASLGGKTIYALQNSFLIRDEKGNPSCLASVITDITERKRAEEALRDSEARFRSYFEQGLIGMAVTSADMRWTQVNDRLCEILGYSREELLKMKWTEPTHPDDLQAGLLQFGRMAAGKIDYYTQDKRFLRKDGQLVNATVFVRCFRHADGAIDHILALIEDTTERKQAQEALRQSEERYRNVVEDQTEVISRFKADGEFVFVNDVFCRFFGKTSRELVGSTWQPVVLPEDLPMVEERLHAMSPSNPIAVIENRVHSGLGQVHWMQFVNRGFFDREGRLTEIQSVGRDITERKQAQEALERERQSLWRMLQASDHERQLIAYEIHDELAQLMTGAIMQYQAYAHLKDHQPSKAKTAFAAATEMLQMAHAETRRLISGVRPPVLDEAGLETAIAHLVHDRRALQGPTVEYKSEVHFHRLPRILENALYRIAQEGLANACKHSESAKITLHLVQAEETIRLEIQDWGIGFDPQLVKEGHFGLEGIRERVRLLGGQLVIDSGPGRGTLIRVETPILEKPTEV